MQYKTLNDKQEKFLLKCYNKIEETFMGGATYVYQWELVKEMAFINRVLSNREYDIQYDSDRLNSLGNLYRHIIGWDKGL
jgi:hypothetical protein